MPQPKIILQIPEPCSEDWNAMAPQATGGRHCTSCAKTVFDFTHLSDDELLKIFNGRQATNLCCRLTEAQMNRELIPTPRPHFLKAQWQRAAAVVIAVQAFATQAAAQQARKPHPVTATPAHQRHEYLEGQVKSFGGGLLPAPITFTISIEQSQVYRQQVTTDDAGHFCIKLPENSRMKDAAIGWDRQEINNGILLADTLRLNQARDPREFLVFWQPVISLDPVMVETAAYSRVSGGAPISLPYRQPAKRSFFKRALFHKKKRQ